MKRGENLDSIPIDLIHEIFSRLPPKSIGRFRCLSKLWRSMLTRPYFNELFLTRSSDHPRLLFGVKRNDKWLFFSSPQPQNQYDKLSLVVAPDFHMEFSTDISIDKDTCSYVSGLIYFPNMLIETKYTSYMNGVGVICNPITGQHAIFPKLLTFREMRSFLGFDPIDKQYKVLLIHNIYRILTLGTENLRWRKIQCPLVHYPFRDGICINGVLYYLARPADGSSQVIGCFDVRSERCKFIDAKYFDLHSKMINYKGKLGGICCQYGHVGGRHVISFSMWVLEDVQKQEWSKRVYPLPDNKVFKAAGFFSVVGVTAQGDIVFWDLKTDKPFYVFYFNPERNTLQRVEIQSNHEVFHDIVYAFVDHIEDLKFNIMKKTYVVPSTSPPEEKLKPTSTETSSSKDHQELTSTSSRKNHQVKTVAHLQQESTNKFNDESTVAHPQQARRRTFESISKFKAQPLLDDDDESTCVKICESVTSHLHVSCVLVTFCSLIILFFLVIVFMAYVL